MPAIAAISINDGAATPVSRTYNPVTTNGSKAEWADRSAAIPAGFRTISHELRRPSSASAAQRIITTFHFPVIETVNGTSVVTRYSSAKVELNLAHLSTEQERKDVNALVANYLLHAQTKLSIQNLEPVY